ncbi:MAG: radical SAM protein, partial [Clostridia bacterium]|nr:radical SAM protein [Clostridia bacterium]
CFRIPADYLRIMRKNAPGSPLAFDRYEYKDGTNGYPDEKQTLVTGYVEQKLEECGVPREKIYSYS